MQTLPIFRAGTLLKAIPLNYNDALRLGVMQAGEMTLNFVLGEHVAFGINDYATVYGDRYTINVLPGITRRSSNDWEYTLTLQGPGADLGKAQFLFLGANNELKETDFSL